MKILSFVLLSFCLLCGAGGWRAFEASDARQALDRAVVAMDRVADNAGDKEALVRARQDYWMAKSRVNRFEEIARGCFMAAFCFGLGSLFVLAYGERGRRAPRPAAQTAVAEFAEPQVMKSPTRIQVAPERASASANAEEVHEEHHAVGASGKQAGHE